MSVAILKRLRAMDGTELRFRAGAAVRSRLHRARTALSTPAWRRESLQLASDAELSDARAALARQDWMGAHRLLAGRISGRRVGFPLDSTRLPALAAEIDARFGRDDAIGRGERILEGRYDLLGYRDLLLATPPDWHSDPVHGRTAPRSFWDAVPYLDAACGDHKITWELNRHQHFLALGRAYALTSDRRFYDEFTHQLTDWMLENPPLLGTNWASMLELAFRSLSWLWALHFFAPAAGEHDKEPWVVDLLLALDRQLQHVEENLSRYFSPNTHLTGEALALYVGGRALPELASSGARAHTGRTVLLEEAHRQVRADGMHAELSAHYHRYSTDFYLLALNVARGSGDPLEAAFEDAARRQAHALRLLADDAGRLPLLGDDDGGQLFPICGRHVTDCTDSLAAAAVLLGEPGLALGQLPEEAWWLCGSGADLSAFAPSPAPVRSAALRSSGYYISRNERGDHLIFDAGPHGFLNGGHAHADALAVVLTVRGRPFLVDPGTATYTMDLERRDRFRSSAMHNTVVVNGGTQSEPAGPFHWRTRTDAAGVSWQTSPHRDYISGRHEGYAPVVHTREVMSLHGTGWIIVDHLTGGDQATAAAMWHVHPDWTLDRLDGNVAAFRHADGLEVTMTASVPLEQVTSGLNEYAPEYGRIVRAPCLRSVVTGPTPLSLAAFIVASSVHSG